MNTITKILLSLLMLSFQAVAFDTVKVADDVYALVGDLGQRSPQNLGHDMTSGFIITKEGVAVVDAGGSIGDARAIHKAIQAVTSKPIRWVINTGGLDHRWIGNSYFATLKGVKIIASEACKAAIDQRKGFMFAMAKKYIKKAFEETNATLPDITFADHYILPTPDKEIKLIYTGGGHSSGDIFVVLPKERIVFTGDIVFHQRLLGVPSNDGLRWIKTLEYLRDVLKPKIIIPGHGAVTDLAHAMHDSYDYLMMLKRGALAGFKKGAFDAVEAVDGLDQSAFSYLRNYDDVPFRSKNALKIARELEKSAAQ